MRHSACFITTCVVHVRSVAVASCTLVANIAHSFIVRSAGLSAIGYQQAIVVRPCFIVRSASLSVIGHQQAIVQLTAIARTTRTSPSARRDRGRTATEVIAKATFASCPLSRL